METNKYLNGDNKIGGIISNPEVSGSAGDGPEGKPVSQGGRVDTNRDLRPITQSMHLYTRPSLLQGKVEISSINNRVTLL